MAQWFLSLTSDAERDFQKLDHEARKRVFQKLEWLAENFDAAIPVPLTGPWQGFFKLRVGDWRVIYRAQYETLSLKVYVIDRRDRVYKRKP